MFPIASLDQHLESRRDAVVGPRSQRLNPSPPEGGGVGPERGLSDLKLKTKYYNTLYIDSVLIE